VSIPRAPTGAGTAGKKLWKAVLDSFELAEHEQTLLRQAVRVADLCEQLQAVVDAEGAMLTGHDNQPRTHPAVIELRQQRIVLARLVVALRVPLGDQETDGPTGEPARLQRRGPRGVYAIGGSG
jgi:hypothetical protein